MSLLIEVVEHFCHHVGWVDEVGVLVDVFFLYHLSGMPETSVLILVDEYPDVLVAAASLTHAPNKHSIVVILVEHLVDLLLETVYPLLNRTANIYRRLS